MAESASSSAAAAEAKTGLKIRFADITKHNVGQVGRCAGATRRVDACCPWPPSARAAAVSPHGFASVYPTCNPPLVPPTQVRTLNKALIPVDYSDNFYKSITAKWPEDNPYVQLGTLRTLARSRRGEAIRSAFLPH